jgi:hypothetical protein
VHFQARRAVIARPGLTQHTLTTGDGTVVKEFVNASGQVFAVSWQGPWRPDLSRLLGAYYKDYLSQGASPQGTRTRQAIGLTRSDLVIRTGGHPSAFWGQAYLPSGLPAGVNPSELN